MIKDKPCPSCGANDWYADYHRTADGELRVNHCSACDWPPGTPMGPKEWRDHPQNPLNEDRSTVREDGWCEADRVSAARDTPSVPNDIEHYMLAAGRQARALDKIERLLGDLPLAVMPKAVQLVVNEAWACAREHRPDPELIPSADWRPQ